MSLVLRGMRVLALLLILGGCSAAPMADKSADQRFQAHAARVLDEV
jgi:hypothetical protein